MPHAIPHGPQEKVWVDFFEFQSKRYLVRRPKVTTANATIDILKQVFSEYDIPKTLVSDDGPQFASNKFRESANQY